MSDLKPESSLRTGLEAGRAAVALSKELVRTVEQKDAELTVCE